MNEEKKVIIVDDLADTPEGSDFRFVDPMVPKATPLVREEPAKPFGDKVMLANKTNEHGMVLCPACNTGSTFDDGYGNMKTRGPMQYLTVPGRGRALVHCSCVPAMLQLLFPVAKPQPAEKTVQSSITITPAPEAPAAK